MVPAQELLAHFPELRELSSRVTLLSGEAAAVHSRQDVFFEAAHRFLCLRAGALHLSEQQLQQALRALGVQPSALPAALRRLQQQRRLLGFAQMRESAVYARTVGWALQSLLEALQQVPLLGEAVRSSGAAARLYSMDLIASVITLLAQKIRGLPEAERVLYVEPDHGHGGRAAAAAQFTLHEFFQRCARSEQCEYSKLLLSLDPESEAVLLLQLQQHGYATLSADEKVVRLHMPNTPPSAAAVEAVDLHRLKLRVAVASVDQHLHHFEEKMYTHRDQALALKKKGDTVGALQHLKYSKMRQEQRDKLLASRLRLEEAILALETATTNVQLVDAMVSARAALKTTREEAHLSPETVDDVILDFEEELEIQQQISDAIVPKDLRISEDEEAALEAELAALMGPPDRSSEQKTQNAATATASKQVELPSVAGLPAPIVHEAKEEEPERTATPAALHA